MAFVIVFLVISTLATVAPAAVKRDDYASPVSNSQSVSGASSPVYSPSASSATYSQPANSNGYAVSGSNVPYSAAQNGYAGTSGSASAASSGVNDHVASASGQSTFQASPGQSNGNLYYYYYPVQDKSKESATGYQAAASNQYTSSVVNPVSSSDASGASHLDSSSSSASTGSSPDLSYSAQDLTYSAQALNPGLSEYSGSAQTSSNYDQTLSSLASQLSQYGYGSGNQASYATQGNSAPTNYAGHSGQSGNNAYTAGSNYGYDTSAVANSQENPGQFGAASNPVPNYGVNPSQATFIPAGPNAGANAGAMPSFNPQAFAQFQNQMPFGSYPQPSMPQASFEPTAASGYRRYGIGSFLMPMLALAGLSLLIPTVTSLTASGRKKRSIEGVDSAKESAFGKYFDRLERYYSIYKTAVEREECMNRIICELGDAMSGVRGKSPLFS